MYFISILFLTILIPSVQSVKPTRKLTFTPDEKYFIIGHHVDISCEIINSTKTTEQPQLWYIDLKTDKRTAISRLLLNSPSDDAPEMFKQNKNRRLEYIKRNHVRLKRLQVEDSARYECNCPDCEEPLIKQTKELQVMKLVEPKWHFEPGWPLQENDKSTLKCTADDFYPYVGYRIVRNYHELNNDGKSTLPTSSTYPQNFSWEITVIPRAEWHDTTLRCTVIQGNTEQHAMKHLNVLFTPRFLRCKKYQYVYSMEEKSTIECSYAGNPAPHLRWLRQTDKNPLTSDAGIIAETRDDRRGTYKSVVTFNRDKLIAIPLNEQTQTNATGKNYYEQLLTSGFIVELTYNNEIRDTRNIHIILDEHLETRGTLNNFEDASNKQNRVIFCLASHSLILQFILLQIKKTLQD